MVSSKGSSDVSSFFLSMGVFIAQIPAEPTSHVQCGITSTITKMEKSAVKKFNELLLWTNTDKINNYYYLLYILYLVR